MSKRTLPNRTELRESYGRFGSLNTAELQQECDIVIDTPSELTSQFLAAVAAMARYDNRDEAFYPAGRSEPKRDAGGTAGIIQRLADAGEIHVPALDGYSFSYRHREVGPLRTTRSVDSNNVKATKSGHGGIDYVALRTQPIVPILGEIKFSSDRDPFYAFVQLLTYLSELSSEAQTARASQHLFAGKVAHPAQYDLHILLADFKDRGKKGPLVDSTRRAAEAFKRELISQVGTNHSVGKIVCLRMQPDSFHGELDLAWQV